MSQRRRSAFQALSKASASVSLDLAERQLRISKVLGQVRSQSQKREQEQVAFPMSAAIKSPPVVSLDASGGSSFRTSLAGKCAY